MMAVKGLSVAVVGRAASLAGSSNGLAIDACDYVVRVNWMLPVTGDPADVGTRTDLVYHCCGCTAQRDGAAALGVPAMKVDTKLRKTLSRRPRWVRPTTGVVAVFDALRSGARRVHAFGFDLYRSEYAEPAPAWSGDKVPKWSHDTREDHRLFRKLLDSEPRFEPDATLRDVLEAVHA